jgi:hypothetical protein
MVNERRREEEREILLQSLNVSTLICSSAVYNPVRNPALNLTVRRREEERGGEGERGGEESTLGSTLMMYCTKHFFGSSGNALYTYPDSIIVLNKI